jgi:hypothetical protein
MDVRFSRDPYTVVFKDFHTGKIQRITRRPPPLQHDMLPEDIVTLSRRSNDDWDLGTEATIKGINPRNPNVLQLEQSNGDTKFLNAVEVNLEKQVADRPGEKKIDSPRYNRYLTWP